MSKTPNPGSPEAILKGCICARLDNNWGAGMYTDLDGVTMFVMRGDCPLHGFGGEVQGIIHDKLWVEESDGPQARK